MFKILHQGVVRNCGGWLTVSIATVHVAVGIGQALPVSGRGRLGCRFRVGPSLFPVSIDRSTRRLYVVSDIIEESDCVIVIPIVTALITAFLLPPVCVEAEARLCLELDNGEDREVPGAGGRRWR